MLDDIHSFLFSLVAFLYKRQAKPLYQEALMNDIVVEITPLFVLAHTLNQ